MPEAYPTPPGDDLAGEYAASARADLDALDTRALARYVAALEERVRTLEGTPAPASPRDPLALLDTDAAAQRLGISPRSVRHLRSEGHLRAVRIGGRVLYSPDALEAYTRAAARGHARPIAPRSSKPRAV